LPKVLIINETIISFKYFIISERQELNIINSWRNIIRGAGIVQQKEDTTLGQLTSIGTADRSGPQITRIESIAREATELPTVEESVQSTSIGTDVRFRTQFIRIEITRGTTELPTVEDLIHSL
jgi:hypothetical protein